MKFSIIVVTLNPGDKLQDTINSICTQSFEDYEILVKDGGSKDGSLKALDGVDKVRLVENPDKSIYDGMNQAVREAKGDYYIFMNAGDLFADEKVLAVVAKALIETKADILYGDQIRKGSSTIIPFPEKLTDFGCFRNVPCHQVCFYKRHLFEKRAYDLKYVVRCDYEHFLYSKYKLNAVTAHVAYPISVYEGGGFSETAENLKISKAEHKEITKMYLGGKSSLYRLIMVLTLQPLREKMAGSSAFSGIYQGIKRMVYGNK